MLTRVQKIMAEAGIASRRKSEELIKKGVVTVNGQTIVLGSKADSEKDIIKVNGRRLKIEEKVYLMFNKPKNCVTTVTDPYGRKTVMDFIRLKTRLFPVGRLDKDTEGLLLLTNDGELANRIMHPSYELTKTYHVVVAKPISRDHIRRLQKGIYIERRKVQIHKIKPIGPCSIEIDIHEGRKHIVRKIFAKLELPVVRLVRNRIGPVILRDISPGKYKRMTKRQLDFLRSELKLK